MERRRPDPGQAIVIVVLIIVTVISNGNRSSSAVVVIIEVLVIVVIDSSHTRLFKEPTHERREMMGASKKEPRWRPRGPYANSTRRSTEVRKFGDPKSRAHGNKGSRV